MTFEASMVAYLRVQVPSVSDRITPFGKRLQGETLPAITYAVVSGPTSHYSHGGVSDHALSVQFDCWSTDGDEATAVAAELQTALDGYRGTWGGFRIGSVFLTTVLDAYEAKTGLYRRLRQADIHYSTPAG